MTPRKNNVGNKYLLRGSTLNVFNLLPRYESSQVSITSYRISCIWERKIYQTELLGLIDTEPDCWYWTLTIILNIRSINRGFPQVYILQEYYSGGGGSKIYAPSGKYLCTLCILYQFLDIWSNFYPKCNLEPQFCWSLWKITHLTVILPKNTVLTGLCLSTSRKIFMHLLWPL